MSARPSVLSRRAALAHLVALGAAGRAAAQEPVGANGTPGLTIGPFYPLIRPQDQDADLTQVRGRRGRAMGQVIDVAGRVTRGDGAPIAGAVLDLWQANAFGRYDHPGDLSEARPDPFFQGAALLRTDAQGRFRFRTVRPGPYAGRAPHIHFDVKGRRRRVLTQMFFPDEPLNGRDRHYGSVPEALRPRVVARAGPAEPGAPPLFIWDIGLYGE